jgi:acetyl esterase/lipase
MSDDNPLTPKNISHMPSLVFRTVVCLISLFSIATANPLRVPLWPDQAPNGDGTFSSSAANLTVFLPERPNGAAMIICPGGAYAGLTTGPEGSGIATWLNQHNMVGIVLEYRLPQGNSALPLLDAQRALRLARSNAGEWKFDPKRLGIIGFSAGGHLASTAATHFDAGNARSADLIERFNSRPDFAVLIYPVISMGELAHEGSRQNLLGASPGQKSLDYFSSEKQVTGQTPPTFLAHAKDDQAVSSENSRVFADALKSHHVPFEYLELPSGGHGLNGYSGPSWNAWQTRSLQWLDAQASP